MLLSAPDIAFEHLEDEEVPDAIDEGLYSTVQDPKKERYTSYVNRERLDWRVLERLKIIVPAQNKGCTLLRIARIDDRSYDKLINWTGESCDSETIAHAMVRLDRPGRRIGVQRQGGSQVGSVFYGNDDEPDSAMMPPHRLLVDERPGQGQELRQGHVEGVLQGQGHAARLLAIRLVNARRGARPTAGRRRH